LGLGGRRANEVGEASGSRVSGDWATFVILRLNRGMTERRKPRPMAGGLPAPERSRETVYFTRVRQAISPA